MKDILGALGNFLKEIFSFSYLDTGLSRLLEALGLELGSKSFSVLHFFLYDSIQIFFLLFVLVFGISYIQSYFPPQRTKEILGSMNGFWGRIFGALLGILTPFCSCSSIPLFIGFCSAGLSIGVTLSFLIMSPMADLASLAILISEFGYKIALAYLLSGLVIAILSGYIIEKLGFVKITAIKATANYTSPSQKERIKEAKNGAKDIIKRVWLYILLGVAIGSFIHNLLPQNLVESVLGADLWYSVLLACAVGIPMYADTFAAIPVALALLEKGAGLGTVLSFLMSVTALSLPSLVMLSKVMSPRLLAAFVITLSLGIILIGYIFNAFAYIFI